MNKTQKIMIGLAILQLLLTVFVFWNKQPSEVSSEALLSNLDSAQITAIEISDNSNNNIALTRESGGWVLSDSDNFPVLDQNISTLIEQLQNIRTGRLVTNTQTSHERLEVSSDNYQRRITLRSTGGDYVVYLGSSPAPSNVHVRLSTQDAVYLTNAISTTTASAQVSNWINTAYIQIDANQVSQIQVANANSEFQFIRGADNNWQFVNPVTDGPLDPSKWSSYVTAFTNLRMVMPISTQLDEQYGLQNPAARVTLHFSENGEEKVAELVIGKQDEQDQNYYAKWSLSPYVVKISSFNAERIINLTLMDLVTSQATVTP